MSRTFMFALAAGLTMSCFDKSSDDDDDDDDDDDGSGSAGDGGSGDGGSGDGGSGDGGSGDGGSDDGGSDDGGSDDGGDPDDGLGDSLDCDLEGRTFRMDLDNAIWVQPEGVGDLMASQLEGDVYITVSEFGGGALQGVGAIFENGSQDYCEPSIELPEASFGDPDFSVGPADTVVSTGGISYSINNLYISGMFASDCSWVGRGQFSGELDARELVETAGDLLGVSEAEDLCELMTGFGTDCIECESDGEELCIILEIENITGVESSGDSVECVDEEDCHPACDSNECDDPEDGEC